jgi:hypothetical protein
MASEILADEAYNSNLIFGVLDVNCMRFLLKQKSLMLLYVYFKENFDDNFLTVESCRIS